MSAAPFCHPEGAQRLKVAHHGQRSLAAPRLRMTFIPGHPEGAKRLKDCFPRTAIPRRRYDARFLVILKERSDGRIAVHAPRSLDGPRNDLMIAFLARGP